MPRWDRGCRPPCPTGGPAAGRWRRSGHRLPLHPLRQEPRLVRLPPALHRLNVEKPIVPHRHSPLHPARQGRVGHADMRRILQPGHDAFQARDGDQPLLLAGYLGLPASLAPEVGQGAGQGDPAGFCFSPRAVPAPRLTFPTGERKMA